MNKRQRKKLDKKITVAVRELNDDVAKSENLPLITDEEVQNVVDKIKKSKESVNQTLKAHRRLLD